MKGKNKMVIRLLGITKESIVRVDEVDVLCRRR